MVKVGIIANPISARDIRRVISHAGNLPINDRANIVLRMMTGLAASGVGEVVAMPENGGIRFHLERSIGRETRLGHMNLPHLRYLDMPVTATPEDSARAARMMAAEGVTAIVVLGGDGTNRVVVGACGGVPVAGVSTGTNNAFPELREPTITGLAVGLAATGQVPGNVACHPNKWLEVRLNDRREIALVDVAVVEDRFVGARAIWKTTGFRDLFVTFGLPQAIGMSSIAGLLDPVDRSAPEGRHIRLSPDAPRQLLAPIAPGLIDRLGGQDLTGGNFIAGTGTIEQLAEYIGVEPAALSATVEQYNKVCAEGYDSDFAKDPHFLNAVAKAPFYAHVTTPSLGFALVTTGGFVTTNDQQVLNEDYQPIEGLYASGNTCGMRFGPEYITPIPGVSIGMCLTLGRELGKYLAAK